MPGFTEELKTIIKSLSNRKQHVYIIGDVNINFLRYNEHANTEDYLNMLYSNNFFHSSLNQLDSQITLPL